MAVAAPSRPFAQTSRGWPEATDERLPIKQHSLKRSQNSLEDLNRKRSQYERSDDGPQRMWAGTSMRVGNVSHGRMELRPVPHQPRLPPPEVYKFDELNSPTTQDTTWRDSLPSTTTFSDLQFGQDSEFSGRAPRSQAEPLALSASARSRSFTSVSDTAGYAAYAIQNHVKPKQTPNPTSKSRAVTYSLYQPHANTPQYQNQFQQRQDADSGALRTTSFKTASSATPTPRPSHSVENRQAELPPFSRDAGQSKSLDYTKSRVSRSVGSTSPKRRTVAAGSRSSTTASRLFPETSTTVVLEAPHAPGEERSIVRISNLTGQVMAATTAGLIAQITSPNFLDYDLLSDFFLTFRSYMTSSMLMDTLVVRLAWAMSRTDDFGRIVRVRVFVALRHWILNYFPDDFLEDLNLRLQFCGMTNTLTLHLTTRNDGGDGDLKVIGELKKCWRRTCALYWDIPEHQTDRALDGVFPGGTESVPAASLAATSSNAERVREMPHPAKSARSKSAGRSRSRSTGVNGRQEQQVNEITSTQQNPHRPKAPSARDSDQSTHAVSCSLPVMASLKGMSKNAQGLGVTTVDASGRKDLLKHYRSPSKRNSVRPNHSRSGSFTDNSREAGLKLEVPTPGLPDFNFNRQSSLAGSLVRGISVEPLSPSVPTILPSKPYDARSSTSITEPLYSESEVSVEKAVSHSNPPMRRFFGGMRKAFAGKNMQPMSGNSALQLQPDTGVSQELLSRPAPSGKDELPSQPTVQVGIDLLAAKASTAYYTAFRLPRSQPEGNAAIMNSMVLPKEGPFPSPGASRISRSVVPGNRPGSSGRISRTPQIPTASPSNDPQSIPQSSPKDQTRGAISPVEHTGNNRILSNQHDSQAVLPAELSGSEPPPQLKRMPGGDLRKADHVHSLIDRSKTFSTGTSELELDLAAGSPLSPRPEEVSPSTLASPQKKISLLSGGSQPIMRPSFEKEVARLRHLPDDDDDGGVESALKKLEGRDNRNNRDSSDLWPAGLFSKDDDSEDKMRTQQFQAEPANSAFQEKIVEFHDSRDLDHQQQRNNQSLESRPMTFFTDQDTPVEPHNTIADDIARRTNQHLRFGSYETESRPRTFFADQSDFEPARESATRSMMTDRSIPLLARGASQQITRRRRSSSDWLTVSLPQQVPPSLAAELAGIGEVSTADKEASDVGTEQRSPLNTHKSFLLDHHQSFNDAAHRSQNQRVGVEARPKQEETFFIDDNTSIMSGNQGLKPRPSHPFRLSSTPPRTLNWLSEQRKERLHPSVRDHPPPEGFKRQKSAAIADPIEIPQTGLSADTTSIPRPPGTKHIPFTLCYPSRLLAQQFALIETDALSEIDWRELIDLRWKQAATSCQTWSDCLSPKKLAGADYTPSGVDVCISRFNMVVDWTASEIVLCDDLNQRVACIIKFIHIAQQARSMQNWATMYQIAAALVSADISRLKMTWERVPQREKEIMSQLESLITPLRNFQNLRAEMERASLVSDAGCIPFIGIYTHDLIYNAQKPAYSQQTDGLEQGERLINFEKHRTAAGIVKNLLRMLDSSSKYDFEPVLDVLSRCLWTACLDKAEISARSKMLEP